MTDHTPELINEMMELKAMVRKLRAELGVAAAVIDLAYGILDANGFEAVERAKLGLRAYIEDQIANGGYKRR